jgi:hypothetical protein
MHFSMYIHTTINFFFLDPFIIIFLHLPLHRCMSTKAFHVNLQIHLIVRSSVSMFQFLLVGRGTFMFQSLTWLYGVLTSIISCVVLQLNMNNMQMNSAMILFTQHGQNEPLHPPLHHARWLVCGHETLFLL